APLYRQFPQLEPEELGGPYRMEFVEVPEALFARKAIPPSAERRVRLTRKSVATCRSGASRDRATALTPKPPRTRKTATLKTKSPGRSRGCNRIAQRSHPGRAATIRT
ncbi:hypothetical protein RNS34_12645, partial [Staphylococcus pseudintermedius]